MPPHLSEWERIRAEVHQATQGVLGLPALRLTDIDATALHATDGWDAQGRSIDWNWRTLARQSGHQVRTAIWHDDRLCGLMCGSAGDTAVVLRYLEGAPSPTHPLKGRVADIGVATAEIYARAIGAAVLLLNDPIPPLVVRFSANPGYSWMTETAFQGYFGRKVMP